MNLYFKTIDRFNRPVFVNADQTQYYGTAVELFHHGATEEEVLNQTTAEDLTYFGSKFDCEPCGYPPKYALFIASTDDKLKQIEALKNSVLHWEEIVRLSPFTYDLSAVGLLRRAAKNLIMRPKIIHVDFLCDYVESFDLNSCDRCPVNWKKTDYDATCSQEGSPHAEFRLSKTEEQRTSAAKDVLNLLKTALNQLEKL